MTAAISFRQVAVEPAVLRLGDHALPLRRVSGTRAEVTWRGSAYRLRAWTFGERRALLSAYVDAGGSLDTLSLSAAALVMLVRPVPEDPRDRDVVGLAALAWSATGGSAVAPPVPGVDPATQTVRLATVTGWRARDIDRAPAADVDQWFAALPGPAPAPPVTPAAGDSFRTFRLED